MNDTWFGILACSLVGLALAIAGLVRLVVLVWLRSNGVRAIGRVVRLNRTTLAASCLREFFFSTCTARKVPSAALGSVCLSSR